MVCGLLGGFVSYRYKRRNLPCHIGGEELTWCVAGEELSEDLTYVRGAGVIEWCTTASRIFPSAVPNRCGKMFSLSSPAPLGNSVSTIAAHVANKSVRQTGASHVVAGAIRPGHRASNGTRCPPSHASDFWPRK